ncbi:MAG: acetyltransferase [Labilithrix sp.]|jgi:RimJ/RimL family protein N-acetyltransferase|nr:acetyltransferase [Labilithrix sp.]
MMGGMAVPDPRWFLRSERLGFREWTPADLGLARGLWGDPAVTALIAAHGPLSDEAIQERLMEEIDHAESHGVQYWPIFELTTGNHIGCCGLHPRIAEAGIYELGFHLRSEHWDKGFASEAARAVIAYAFDRLESRELFAGHHPKNDASRRILTKLGFTYTHDEPFAGTGLLHPSYVLRRDSPERRHQ